MGVERREGTPIVREIELAVGEAETEAARIAALRHDLVRRVTSNAATPGEIAQIEQLTEKMRALVPRVTSDDVKRIRGFADGALAMAERVEAARRRLGIR